MRTFEISNRQVVPGLPLDPLNGRFTVKMLDGEEGTEIIGIKKSDVVNCVVMPKINGERVHRTTEVKLVYNVETGGHELCALNLNDQNDNKVLVLWKIFSGKNGLARFRFSDEVEVISRVDLEQADFARRGFAPHELYEERSYLFMLVPGQGLIAEADGRGIKPYPYRAMLHYSQKLQLELHYFKLKKNLSDNPEVRESDFYLRAMGESGEVQIIPKHA